MAATSIHGARRVVWLPPFWPAVEARGKGGAQTGRHLHRGAALGSASTDEAASQALHSSRPAMEARETKTERAGPLMLDGGDEDLWRLLPLQQYPSDGVGALPLFLATGVALLRSASLA